MDMVSGKAKACAVYPDLLCRAICSGIKAQVRKDEKAAARICSMMDTIDLLAVVSDDVEYWFWDDSKGGFLDPDLVLKARAKELEYIRKMKVYDKIPRSQGEKELKGRKPV